MKKTIAFYAAALAVVALFVQWIEYRHFARAFSTELYIVLIACLFIALGIWVGRALTPAKRAPTFVANDRAIAALGLTPRECEVLDHLAAGRSNKEIARLIDVSPNTVKSHVAHIFGKLEVGRRSQAVTRARELSLVA